jgi:hypothetical protein
VDHHYAGTPGSLQHPCDPAADGWRVRDGLGREQHVPLDIDQQQRPVAH